jgi:hypothetical protein
MAATSIEAYRDSVSAADLQDRAMAFEVDEKTTIEDIFDLAIGAGYFPAIPGGGVWVLRCGYDEWLAWVVDDNMMIAHYDGEGPAVLAHFNEGGKPVRFQCFLSAAGRAEYIFKLFKGQKGQIWHEGSMKEYEHYKIPAELEAKWMAEMQAQN